MASGEEQDGPSRGGAGNGADETRAESQGDGADWLLRRLGADGAAEDSSTTAAVPEREPGTPRPPRPPRGPRLRPAAREPGAAKPPRMSRASARQGAALPADPGSPGTGDERRKIVLLLIALAVAAVLALASLFFLGMRLGAGSADTATETPTPAASAGPSGTASPAPTPTGTPTAEPAPAAGPVAPGAHSWDELRGGECLDPYASPWEEEYTVVDCADPHPAQLVFRGEFLTDSPGYPGEQAIAPQLSLLCSAPTVIDTAAAAPYNDLQVQGAYPATTEQWEAGQRDIFCFVSRSSGEPLTGSIAVPQAAPPQ